MYSILCGRHAALRLHVSVLPESAEQRLRTRGRVEKGCVGVPILREDAVAKCYTR